MICTWIIFNPEYTPYQGWIRIQEFIGHTHNHNFGSPSPSNYEFSFIFIHQLAHKSNVAQAPQIPRLLNVPNNFLANPYTRYLLRELYKNITDRMLTQPYYCFSSLKKDNISLYMNNKYEKDNYTKLPIGLFLDLNLDCI